MRRTADPVIEISRERRGQDKQGDTYKASLKGASWKLPFSSGRLLKHSIQRSTLARGRYEQCLSYFWS